MEPNFFGKTFFSCRYFRSVACTKNSFYASCILWKYVVSMVCRNVSFFSNSRCPISTLSGLFIFPPVHVINASEVPCAWVQVPRVPFWCEWGQMMGVLFVLHHSRKIGGWGFPEKMKLSSLRQTFLTSLGQRKLPPGPCFCLNFGFFLSYW